MEDNKNDNDNVPASKGKWKWPAIYLSMVLLGVAIGTVVFFVLNRGGPYDNGPMVVEEGVLYRCKEPTEFSDRNVLKEFGIKTVVNTRIDGEKDDNPAHYSDGKKLAADAGAEFIAIPVGEVLPADGQVLQFLRIVRFGAKPVLVHCQLGKSRTGTMVAAYRIVMQGWSAADAMKEMQSFGYHDDDGKHAQRVALLERLEKDRGAWLAKVNSPSGGVLESGELNPADVDVSSQPVDSAEVKSHESPEGDKKWDMGGDGIYPGGSSQPSTMPTSAPAG